MAGFTIAECSSGLKAIGSVFCQIKQKGIENYNIIKAKCVLIANREPNIKVDSSNCYQLIFNSKTDPLTSYAQKVVNFFSASDTILYAVSCYKLIQYNE